MNKRYTLHVPVDFHHRYAHTYEVRVARDGKKSYYTDGKKLSDWMRLESEHHDIEDREGLGYGIYARSLDS